MKIKVFSAGTERGLEKKVNTFLEGAEIDIIDMKFAGGFGFIAVMIRYSEKAED